MEWEDRKLGYVGNQGMDIPQFAHHGEDVLLQKSDRDSSATTLF